MSPSALPLPLRLSLAAGLCLLALSTAQAAEVVIYRCTDASGALTLQNSPCPKGMKQEQRTMQGVNSVPMAPAPASAPAVPASTPVSTVATPASSFPPPSVPTTGSASHLPPPVLFQCTTHDKGGYITEEAEPASRCVSLQTVGLDGNPQAGAGQACEIVRDTCARVPDGALCDAWKRRRDETEVAARFARPENVAKNRAEYERVVRIVTESSCGQ